MQCKRAFKIPKKKKKALNFFLDLQNCSLIKSQIFTLLLIKPMLLLRKIVALDPIDSHKVIAIITLNPSLLGKQNTNTELK